MKKILLLSLILLASCSLDKVVQHHGVHNLEKKQTYLKINQTNKNEMIKLIGPPSTKSTFDNDVYIYIERKTSSSRLTKLGQKKLITNNVLVLEIDKRGILLTKKFYDKNDMKNYEFDNDKTAVTYTKKSFINTFMNSMIQRIDDPLGKKRVKN